MSKDCNIGHADSVSKLLRQIFFFFARVAIVSGKKYYISRHNGYNQRLGSPVPKQRQFCVSSWARVLKRGKKREKQWIRRLGISAVTIRFTDCCPFFASDLMHNSTSCVINQLVHAFSCALSS